MERKKRPPKNKAQLPWSIMAVAGGGGLRNTGASAYMGETKFLSPFNQKKEKKSVSGSSPNQS